MKHAGPDALDRLEPLLCRLRKRPLIKEKSRGIFYRNGRAFLHFHEHGHASFADLRTGAEFERFPSTTRAHWKALLRLVDTQLAAR